MFKLNNILIIPVSILFLLFLIVNFNVFSPPLKENFSESYYSCVDQGFPRDFCLKVPFQSKL